MSSHIKYLRLYLAFLIVTISLSGCGVFVSSKQPENVKIYYSNGNLFVEGNYKVYDKFFSEHKNKMGTWSFYHPNGVLAKQVEYDNDGEVLNSKKYLDDGVLIQQGEYSDDGEVQNGNVKEYLDDGTLLHSTVVNEDTEVETDYYSTGELKSETITSWKEVENDWEYSESIKQYYKTGGLKSEMKTENGEPYGVHKMWDEKGDLILEIKYEDGLIVIE